MALLVPDEGELELLDKMLKDALSTDEDFILNLFKNNYTPMDASTSTDFTVADFSNYVVKTLDRVTWSASKTVATKAESSYGTTPLSWTCGATGNTIYGYWVEGAASSIVCWAERFGTSRVLAMDDVLNLTPKFTLATE